jgi:hypothetical protein
MSLFYQALPTFIGAALIGIAGLILLWLERREERRSGLRPPRSGEEGRAR